MLSTLLAFLPLVAAPVGGALVGAVIAALRPPGPTLRSAIQHFAAGVVFTAVALEVLPEVAEQPLVDAVLGVSAGIGSMLALRWIERRFERKETEKEKGQPAALPVPPLWREHGVR